MGNSSEIVKVALNRRPNAHNAKSGLASPHGHAYCSGRDHLEVPVTSRRVAVVVTGENIIHTVLVKQFEIVAPDRERDVEVLVRLVGSLQKIRNVLEDEDVLHLFAAGSLQFA